MANSLNTDLTGKLVLLRKEVLKPKYSDEKFRRVRVLRGFGAVSYTSGSAIWVKFECDGEEARFSGYDVEKIIEENNYDE